MSTPVSKIVDRTISGRKPNVQFVILHHNGRKTFEWRYCSSWTRAAELTETLRAHYGAQRVWF